MLKKIILILLIINIISINVYSMFFDTNTTKGFYINTSFLGQYEPIEGNWELDFFYRMPIMNIDNSLFDNAKIKFGVENDLGLYANIIKAYVDVVPVNLFRLKASIGFTSYYNIIDGLGFYSFDNVNADYSFDTLKNLKSENMNGYFIELEPTISVNVYRFTLISSLKILYRDMGVGSSYFYDDFTYFIRKDKTFSYSFNNYLMFNIYPINIGVNYVLNYMGEEVEIGHKLGVVASAKLNISDKFFLYGEGHVGQYISYNYLTHEIYIEAKLGLQYRIF